MRCSGMFINLHQVESLTTDRQAASPSIDANLERAAKEFEAAFIGQMLTFSGVGDALVSGEGKMASAFTGFFIEALADDLAETGAFGLAEKFYDKLQMDGEI